MAWALWVSALLAVFGAAAGWQTAGAANAANRCVLRGARCAAGLRERKTDQVSASRRGDPLARLIEQKGQMLSDERMEKRFLPRTDTAVSRVGLGTATFGEQVPEREAWDILDTAVKKFEVNFLDCSELNPIPYGASSCGDSDRVVGRWLRTHSRDFRDQLVISAKICGFSDFIKWCRPEHLPTRGNREQIVWAVDAYLERLQVDHIDLLQLQWPERDVPLFADSSYESPEQPREHASVEEQLRAVQELMAAGKVRHFGLSNESPFGIGVFATTAKLLGLPAPVSIQKPYSLLERRDVDPDVKEAACATNANLALLACNPLAGGALTGKYADPKHTPGEARMRKYDGLMARYLSPGSRAAVARYETVARDLELPVHALALAWLFSQPQVTTAFLGVTSVRQLEQNIFSSRLAPLSAEVLEIIDQEFARDREPTKGALGQREADDDADDLPIDNRVRDLDHDLELLLKNRF